VETPDPIPNSEVKPVRPIVAQKENQKLKVKMQNLEFYLRRIKSGHRPCTNLRQLPNSCGVGRILRLHSVQVYKGRVIFGKLRQVN